MNGVGFGKKKPNNKTLAPRQLIDLIKVSGRDESSIKTEMPRANKMSDISMEHQNLLLEV